MKRSLLAFTSAVLLAFAAYVYADSTLIVKPSDMKNGETKTITDDGRTITVTREGNSTVVKIDGAGSVDRLTISREGSSMRIGHASEGTATTFVIGPDRDRRRIVIDGMPLIGPKRGMQTWFVCPKDHTMLRVPEGKGDQTFKCPVDGTVMEKRKGHGFQFFFDDTTFESEEL